MFHVEQNKAIKKGVPRGTLFLFKLVVQHEA